MTRVSVQTPKLVEFLQRPLFGDAWTQMGKTIMVAKWTLLAALSIAEMEKLISCDTVSSKKITTFVEILEWALLYRFLHWSHLKAALYGVEWLLNATSIKTDLFFGSLPILLEDLSPKVDFVHLELALLRCILITFQERVPERRSLCHLKSNFDGTDG